VDEAASGEKLSSIVAGIRAAGADVMAHGSLKTAPKGYPRDHPRVELLRFKGLAAWKDWPAGPWLETPEVLEMVRGFLRDAAPLNEWLEKYVGPSTLPARRR